MKPLQIRTRKVDVLLALGWIFIGVACAASAGLIAGVIDALP